MSEQQSPHGVPGPAVPGPDEQNPLGGPTQPAASGGQPSGIENFFNSVRRMGLFRSDDRWVGGVASGVATRFGIDPLLVRAVFFVSFFISGAGLVLYGIGWALMPERSDGRIHLQQAIRGHFDIALLGSLALVIIGLSTSGAGLSWWNAFGLGWINELLWLAAVIGVVWLIVSSINRKKSKTSGSGQQPQSPMGSSAPNGYPAAGSTEPAANASYPAAGTTSHPAPGTTSYPAAGTTSHPAPGTTSYPAAGSTAWSTSQDAPVPEDPQSPYTTYSSPVPPMPAPPMPLPAAQAPRPPKAPKTSRVPGPGSVMTGIVMGMAFLAGAALLLVHRFTDWGQASALLAVGIFVLLVGLGIVITGLRGRRSGILGFFAILALLVGLPAASDWANGNWGGGMVTESGYYSITEPEIAEEGISIGFGSPVYDLSELDLSGATMDNPVRMPISLGAGSLEVIVPDGAAVSADVTIGAGRVHWDVDDSAQSSSGRDNDATFASEEAVDGALLVLDVEIGAGNLTITED